MSLPFLVLAAVTVMSACAAMMWRGLVHCALALAVALAGIGALYLNLGAQFLGLAQMFVYVGAVAVLIVFVILLTRGGEPDAAPLSPQPFPWVGALVAIGVLATLAWAVLHSTAVHLPPGQTPGMTVRALGNVLMESYGFPLEMMGLLLTAALIGAVILAMKEKPGPR